jgi:hypothetical protein
MPLRAATDPHARPRSSPPIQIPDSQPGLLNHTHAPNEVTERLIAASWIA